MRQVRRAQVAVRWIVVSVLLAGGVSGGAAALYRFARPLVSVSQVVEGPVVQAFNATGTLLPRREYPVKSNVEGILTEVVVDKGDPVKRGQELALVMVGEYQYKYEQSRADLELRKKLAADDSPLLGALDDRIKRINEQINSAQRELKRLTDLMEKESATTVDRDRANDRVQQFLGERDELIGLRDSRKLELLRDQEVAQAALNIAQWNLDQQTIKSPIDGVVLDRPVSVGTRVKVNDHLMNVADVSAENLVMRAAVDEEDKTFVRLPRASSTRAVDLTGAQVVQMTLYSFAQMPFQGYVEQVYPMADPTRRTFEVDVRMARPDARFAAGMTGELAFEIAREERAMVVPSQAVQNGGAWVVRDGKAVRVQVDVGLRSVERVQVKSGLQVGDMVVISPAEGLRQGQAVRTHLLDSAVAAGLNKPAAEKAFRGFN